MKRGFLNNPKTKKVGITAKSASDSGVSPSLPDKVSSSNSDNPPNAESETKSNLLPLHKNYVFTSIPLVDDQDGVTQVLLSKSTYAALTATPNFPSRIKRPRKKLYTISDAGNMGRGIFATDDISAGELIWSERPLCILPQEIVPDMESRTFTPEQMTQLHIEAIEEVYNRMTPERRANFDDLFNSHLNDDPSRIRGIIRTNGYGTRKLDNNNLHTSVYGQMSYLNHSCCPNVAHSFNKASLSSELRSFRDIKAGEQLVYDYCIISGPSAERAKFLAPYGVKCQCPACFGPRAQASDKLRGAVTMRFNEIKRLYAGKENNPDFIKKHVLPRALKLLGEMEEDCAIALDEYNPLLNIVVMHEETKAGHNIQLQKLKMWNMAVWGYTY